MKTHHFSKLLRFSHHSLSLAAALGASALCGTTAHASLTYTFTDVGDPVASMQGWTSVFPQNGTSWAKYDWWGADGNLGDGWDIRETQLIHSPEFTLDGSGDLTYQILGTASPLTAPALHSGDIGEIAIPGAGFMGMALRDVATDTYVLWNAHPGTDFATLTTPWPDQGFTAAQLAPYANDGKSYTLDFIDNDKTPTVDDHWVTLDGATIPGALAVSIPEPTPAVLGGLGLLALMRRRQRG